jgi:hypothetical protein
MDYICVQRCLGLESQLGVHALKSCRGLQIIGLDASPCIIEC